MVFKDLLIKEEYRSLEDDIVKDFYNPVLKCATKYQRAVGFFSSSSLVEIADGIAGLVKNNGKIELVASPNLSEDDVDSIKKGLKKKEEVISERISDSITEPNNAIEANKLNYLINLIAYGILDIKIAIIDDGNSIGIFHEKVGIVYDEEGETIAFSGSMNESATAFLHNGESIDVFKSWEDSSDAKRVRNKISSFNAIWNDYEPKMVVMDFPEAARKKLFKYRKNNEIDESDLDSNKQVLKEKAVFPHIPEWLGVREYQQKAIDNWKDNNYKGIFDMATGTGKTYTGLSAIVDLYENRKVPLAIFIVCPLQHLVEQWVEDIKNFGMQPVICYSQSKQKDWKKRLKNGCLSLELGVKDHICAVFTNATYCTEGVQEIIKNIKSQAVLVVDEAHNFGASQSSEYLDENIPYRLALSATLERHGDIFGTEKLFDFFGEKCIEYTLKDAIDNDMLVRYYYHPIMVRFNDDELEEYLELSKQIARAIAGQDGDELSEYAEGLLIKRARLVAATQSKVETLVKEMESFKNESHMLVYCGATTVRDLDYKESNPTKDEKRQVDLVAELLGNKLNMRVAKFTSEENQKKRSDLIEDFDEGEMIQTLIAIRCLDEGVNIPSIRKAFILASSTNPKEYIQRRGRVLRTFEGKTHADIYDFIVSPLNINKIDNYSGDTIRLSQSLVRREIDRMKDFAMLAENSSVADSLIYELVDKYNIDLTKEVVYE